MWPMFGNVRSDFNMQPAVTSRQVRVRDRARVKWVASTRENFVALRWDAISREHFHRSSLHASCILWQPSTAVFSLFRPKIESLPPFVSLLSFRFISDDALEYPRMLLTSSDRVGKLVKSEIDKDLCSNYNPRRLNDIYK